MAKFSGNWQPVTWKNVDTGNPNAFFNGAIQGGDTVFDQQRQINEREDDFRTNEALSDQRLGIPRAFDRRADQVALNTADTQRQTLSSLVRAGDDQHELSQIEIEEAPARLKGYLADVDAKIAATANGARRNELEAERLAALKEERDRQRKLREESDTYSRASSAQHSELYNGFLQESVTQRLGPGGNIEDLSQAERDSIFIDAKSRTDHAMARDVTGQKLRNQLGTSPEAFQQTPTGQALAAAQQRNVTEDELRRKIEGEAADKYGSALEGAIDGDFMSGGLDNNGNFTPIDPKSQVMKGGEFNSMVQGKARKNSEVDFVYSELTPENKKSLTDVAATLPASVLRKLTDNVMAARKDAGGFGTMSGDEFATKFIDAAFEYQDNYESRVDTYTGANQSKLTPAEVTRIAAKKIKTSDAIDTPVPVTPLSEETPEVVDQRVASLKDSFPDAKSDLEFLKKADGVGFDERREIQQLYDKLNEGVYAPPPIQDPYGGPIYQKPIEVSFEDREKALVEFNKIVAKYRQEESANVTAATLKARIDAGLKK